MEPLVSVNITTFNRLELFERAIESVYQQTYKNIEIIVVDDFSNQNYSKVISNFKRSYDNFHYFRNTKNLGNAKSRNIALSKSKGEFVAFLDDDDFWIDKNKLKRQVKVLIEDKQNQIDLSCTSVKRFSSNDNSFDHILEYPKNLQSTILSGNGLIYSPTVLIRRNFLLELNGFDEKFPRGIDSDLFRRIIIFKSKRIHIDFKITTCIREYGLDRMTPINTTKSIKKNLESHFLTFQKFNFIFIFYPKAFLKDYIQF